jgi:hypothetical protein
MRKAAYITLGISIFLFALFSLSWFAGLVFGQTLGGFLHLLLIALVIPLGGLLVGIILLIVSFIKKPN